MAFIYYLTHIHIGTDALLQLESECVRVGIRRPLIGRNESPEAGPKAITHLCRRRGGKGDSHDS